MSTTQKINYVDNSFDIRRIVQNANLQDQDEALNICNLSSIEQKVNLWHSRLPRIKPHYAVKCNDDAMIVKFLADLGMSFDCASKSELKLVLGMNVPPERIIFANPCRPVSHLNYAKKHKVTQVTVDNEFEIYKLSKHYPTSNVLVRFRSKATSVQVQLGKKFGCDVVEDAAALLMLAKALDLKVIGTCFHVGSGCSEIEAYDRAIEKAKNVFSVGNFLGFDMKLLDIGGGFLGDDDGLFEKVAHSINLAIQEHFSDNRIQIISEPGQFYVTAACTVVVKIYSKGEVRHATTGKLESLKYHVNEGAFGMFKCIPIDHRQIKVEHYLDSDVTLPTFKTSIWGPTPDAKDKVCENLLLPNLNRGDLIGFADFGAYTNIIATSFNGFPLPKNVYFRSTHQEKDKFVEHL